MYTANIAVVHAGADAAASVNWAIRNPLTSTRSLHVTRIWGTAFFSGTTSAGTTLSYGFARISGADPTGGTEVPRVKLRSTGPTSQVPAAGAMQKTSPLTITSITVGSPFFAVSLPALVGATAPFDWPGGTAGLTGSPRLILAPGEGLAVVLLATAVANQGISGAVEWEELPLGRG